MRKSKANSKRQSFGQINLIQGTTFIKTGSNNNMELYSSRSIFVADTMEWEIQATLNLNNTEKDNLCIKENLTEMRYIFTVW